MNGDKKANLDVDNADTIITRQIDTYRKLSGNRRLTVNEHRHTDKEVVREIQGLKCMITHGEYRSKDAKKIIKDEMSVNNEFYDILFKGHLHNFKIESENNGRYIISTGCLSGYNDFSLRFNCSSSAGQTIAILTDAKVELIKDVQL
jgi:predicted phosphodiesterase